MLMTTTPIYNYHLLIAIYMTITSFNPLSPEMLPLLREVPLKTAEDTFDPNHPYINVDITTNRESEWIKADMDQKKKIRKDFRDYFTGRSSLAFKYVMYHRLPRPGQFERRDECNPYLVGVDFCGPNGNCFDLNSNGTSGAMFVCECYTGWKGLFCTDDIDECELGLCQNSAMCINRSPGYNCYCQPHTYGFNCERRYSHNPEIFGCASADNSSLIEWIPMQNFKLLLYFPRGISGNDIDIDNDGLGVKLQERVEDVIGKKASEGLNQFEAEQFVMRSGMRFPVYIKSPLLAHQGDQQISDVRPDKFKKFERGYRINHASGLHLKWQAMRRFYPGIEFQHVVQVDFPQPTLVRAFVTKGGMDGSCLFCKRLVTKYRITFRSGSKRWFRIKDDNNQEMVFDAKKIDEWVESYSEIVSLDTEVTRLRYPMLPFTAESIRIHILDWIPRNVRKIKTDLKGGDSKGMIATKFAPVYDPVLRFDIIGCHV